MINLIPDWIKMQQRCKFVNQKTGERCEAFALEFGLCFSHDPKYKKEKLEAIKKGGLAPKRIRLNLPPIRIKTAGDVANVLEEIVNLVRSGKLPCSNPANTIGFLCSQLLKAIIEQDIDIIGRVIAERRTIFTTEGRKKYENFNK